MNTLRFKEREITYDGTQLAPHWLYRTFNLQDDALVSFIGEANVPLDHMVDLEDVKKKAPIYSPKMLHFVAEWFDDSLEVAILRQHLFIGEVYEALWEMGKKDLSRRGNDIYYQGRKFNVSIATKTLTSTLMHTGINIETKGTPIPTSGLAELEIDPDAFAERVMERFRGNLHIIRLARTKVLPR